LYAFSRPSQTNKWPPRSPDITRLDFFLWGFVKDRVFVPHLPANVAEHGTRITAAVVEVTPEVLRSEGKILTTDGTSAELPMVVTSNNNYPR
jgi:hypothetical protein